MDLIGPSRQPKNASLVGVAGDRESLFQWSIYNERSEGAKACWI